MMRGGRRPVSRVPATATAGERPPSFDLAAHRDSDASFCSSRPSSASMGVGRPAASALLTDRASQSAALRSVNAYLSSLSAPIFLKPPLPSARDITDAFRFVLARLEWPLTDLEDDLPALLRALRCPLKLNRSALKAPGTPHAWPPLLSALYWLVQLARVSDLLSSSAAPDPSNDLLPYLSRSYSLFISGDDDAVAALDAEYLRKAEHQAANAAASVDALEKEASELEARVRALTSGPSRREALERERAMLAEDVKKFEAVIESFNVKLAAMERTIGEWESELAAKDGEAKRIAMENEELRKQIEGQAVSVRDAEKMRREMQAVERDILEAENGIISLDEKASEIEAMARQKLKELEALTDQCNQAIRRLKLGNEFHYVLNADGPSPAEVMGINYKTTIKPTLSALAEETKKMSVSKLEESIALQDQSRETTKMLEVKRVRLAAWQAKIDESEAQFNLLKKEMEDHASNHAAEVEKMKEEFTRKEHQLLLVEKEAEEFLKISEQNLQEAIRESDDKTQMCAHELLAVIDAVSEYKEYIESIVSGMKLDLSGTASAMIEAYKSCVSAKLTSDGLNLGHCGLKCTRWPSPN